MNKHKFVPLFVGLCAVAGLSATASAREGIDTPDPSLPPTTGVYMVDTAAFHAIFGPVILNNAVHSMFTNIMRTPMGADEFEMFDSVLTGDVSAGGGPAAPVMLTGPVTTVVFDKVGNTTGTFDTEMLSMDLSGPTPLGPIFIRESPTLPSLGVTSITDLGGGMYHIDSFFDVFTELSIDGGQTWTPSQGPSRVLLCIPEPASVVLVFLALIGLAGMARRRK